MRLWPLAEIVILELSLANSLGGCLKADVVVQLSEAGVSTQALHVEVSLSVILNPKLSYVYLENNLVLLILVQMHLNAALLGSLAEVKRKGWEI